MPLVMLPAELPIGRFMLSPQIAVKLVVLPRVEPLLMGTLVLFIELVVDIRMVVVEIFVLSFMAISIAVVTVSGITVAITGTDRDREASARER